MYSGDGRRRFGDWLKERVSAFELDLGSACPLSSSENVYDFCYSIADHRWMPWTDTAPSLTIVKGTCYENIVVPTLDSIRVTHVFKLLLLAGHHVLCPGSTGTGKTVNITQCLLMGLPENFETNLFSFSAHTNVNQLQVGLHSNAICTHVLP